MDHLDRQRTKTKKVPTCVLLGCKIPRRLKFIWWHLTFCVPHFGTRYSFPSWRLEFLDGSQI